MRYASAPKFFPLLDIAYADGSFDRILAKLAKTDVIAIDDRGLAPLTDIQGVFSTRELLPEMWLCRGLDYLGREGEITISKKLERWALFSFRHDLACFSGFISTHTGYFGFKLSRSQHVSQCFDSSAIVVFGPNDQIESFGC